jgi:hypothetical protein
MLIMRLQKVEYTGEDFKFVRYAGSTAEAREIKKEFISNKDGTVKSKDVDITMVMIETGKESMLEFINDLAALGDKTFGG